MKVKKFILKNIILKKRFDLIKRKKDLYMSVTNPVDIYSYQLGKFNQVWSKAIGEIPFYTMWKAKHNLPAKIKSLEELKYFPVLTKNDIQQNEQLIFADLRDYTVMSTGGSTGEPTKFPTSKIEGLNGYANHYLARGWWGIKPLDDILLFWGHSHLFGRGIKGQINQSKRIILDWLINTRRLNAYDMSADTLGKYYQELKKLNPSMMLGYTSTIYKIAKYIEENRLNIGNKSRLKGVVVTSETVTDYDIELIENIFKVPCILEYGMAETGVIAYSERSSKNIKLFWDTFIGIKDENNILNITTISDKLFPLINYRTDDMIESKNEFSILNIKKILGRKLEILEIQVRNKIFELSGILMVHALKQYEGVYEIQFKQLENKKVKIIFTASKKLDLKHISSFFIKNIQVDHIEIDDSCFEFQQVDDIPKTIAGKAKWIEIEK